MGCHHSSRVFPEGLAPSRSVNVFTIAPSAERFSPHPIALASPTLDGPSSQCAASLHPPGADKPPASHVDVTALLAHELRTPLNALMASLQVGGGPTGNCIGAWEVQMWCLTGPTTPGVPVLRQTAGLPVQAEAPLSCGLGLTSAPVRVVEPPARMLILPPHATRPPHSPVGVGVAGASSVAESIAVQCRAACCNRGPTVAHAWYGWAIYVCPVAAHQ